VQHTVKFVEPNPIMNKKVSSTEILQLNNIKVHS